MGSAGEYKKQYVLKLIFPSGEIELIANDGHAIVDEDEIQFYLRALLGELGTATRREAVKVRRKAVLREQARARRSAKRKPPEAA